MASFGDDTFSVRAAGGTRFYSSGDQSTGVELAAGAGAWADLSDRNDKERDQGNSSTYYEVAKSVLRLSLPLNRHGLSYRYQTLFLQQKNHDGGLLLLKDRHL